MLNLKYFFAYLNKFEKYFFRFRLNNPFQNLHFFLKFDNFDLVKQNRKQIFSVYYMCSQLEL